MSSLGVDRTVTEVRGAAEGRAIVSCVHCDLPVPPGLVSPDGPSFCCEGCRSVYEVLAGCGLERYYDLREAAGGDDGTAGPVRTAARDHTLLDDAVFQSTNVETLPDGTCRVELYLERVHCAACVWLVERLPRLVPGCVESRLSIGTQTATVRWDPARTQLSQVARGLERLGYPPHPARDRTMREHRRREDRAAMIHIAVAGAIAGNVMLIAFALYGGHFHGMESIYRVAFGGVSAVLTAISLAWPGRVFFRGAVGALRTGRPHMDVPIAIGLGAGFAWSVAAIGLGSLDVYFDSIALLVFLLLVGRWIQARQQRRGHDAVALLFAVTPSSARLLDGRNPGAPSREIPLESVGTGDLLEIRTGDTVPVDGRITAGLTTIDEAMLTGESDPVQRTVGMFVHAGTTNLGGRIEMIAEATGRDTRAGRLMELVERSARERPPVVQRADRLAAIFVPVVIGFAAITLAIWWPTDPGRAVAHSMSLLIITCPCALGLATPLAVIAALGQAARRRILVKGGAALEAIVRPGFLVLDKTGTLTMGRRRVAEWTGDPAALAAAAALERHSAHPIAAAIVAHAAEADATAETAATTPGPAPAATEVQETIGLGIHGTVDGRHWRVGRASYLRDAGVQPDAALEAEAHRFAAAGLSPVFIAADDRMVAVGGVGDPLLPGTAESVRQLVAAGWRCEILSGDDPEVVRRTGAHLGIPAHRCRGGRTPEDKLRRVRRLAARATTVVVGDGVNDAAALAAATVGVAVHGGAEASLQAADAYLDRPGLTGVVELVQGARRTSRVITRNLAVSLGYNAVGVSLAMAGLIDPIVAAVLMPASSLTVIMMSYRSRTFAAGGAESETPAETPGTPNPGADALPPDLRTVSA
jgi:Cu2+-exporting ATPase